MPKTYEQECLEIESARISADLAYQREKEILSNKAIFSKREMHELEKKYNLYMFMSCLIGAFLGAWIMYMYCNQSK